MKPCLNCQTSCQSEWSHCPNCGANLKLSKFSVNDDPLGKLKARVDKMDKHLTDQIRKEQTSAVTPPVTERDTLFGED